ncbi:hypothetical protein PGT21_004320 [Puccinia graminis f. sp. tritici]|uniref:Uncharacterized protein n=1 Tax=Puccinia graminis f. sp. tritici TaxID=56615 RepID=A0A5B0MWH5_PUCGR|nr:hypothetical protein PGTUg99_020557 [Puccinia graminis f. sp. tritici]KAA1103908.1 hypothetical protein PGT21_004320 [Puccinia graminis f. sp. tritici]
MCVLITIEAIYTNHHHHLGIGNQLLQVLSSKSYEAQTYILSRRGTTQTRRIADRLKTGRTSVCPVQDSQESGVKAGQEQQSKEQKNGPKLAIEQRNQAASTFGG